MKIQRNTFFGLYMVLAFKICTIALSTYAHFTDWDWVPPSSNTARAVALAFVLSSLVFLKILPKLGIASTAMYGALTFYGATTSLVSGQFMMWSLLAALTGAALVGFAIAGWRQLSSTSHPLNES